VATSLVELAFVEIEEEEEDDCAFSEGVDETNLEVDLCVV